MRRLIPLLVLVLACTSSAPINNGAAPTRSKFNAIVKIHAAPGSTTTDQETVHLCARNGMSGTTPIPSTITWAVDDPTARLDIVWADPAQVCVRGKHCSGPTCSAISNVDFRDPTPARCEYTIVINGTGTKDPGVEVESCCP